MTEKELLGDERVTVARSRTDQAEQKHQIFEHCLNIMPPNVRSRPADFCAPTGGAEQNQRIRTLHSPEAGRHWPAVAWMGAAGDWQLQSARLAAGFWGVGCDTGCRAFDINGVVTDSIFVAGDIARFPHVLYDYQFLTFEHWDNAVCGAEVAKTPWST